MKKTEAFEALTEQQNADLAALEARPNGSVDTTDIPEILDWSGGKRGLFYRPQRDDGAPREPARPRRKA